MQRQQLEEQRIAQVSAPRRARRAPVLGRAARRRGPAGAGARDEARATARRRAAVARAPALPLSRSPRKSMRCATLSSPRRARPVPRPRPARVSGGALPARVTGPPASRAGPPQDWRLQAQRRMGRGAALQRARTRLRAGGSRALAAEGLVTGEQDDERPRSRLAPGRHTPRWAGGLLDRRAACARRHPANWPDAGSSSRPRCAARAHVVDREHDHVLPARRKQTGQRHQRAPRRACPKVRHAQ